MESNIEDSCAHLIDLKGKLKEVSTNLKSKDINAQNEVADKLNKLKRKNTILKRKQTFRSIKDIEAEKIINDIEDKLEAKSRKTFNNNRKPQVTIDSQISIENEPKFTDNSDSKAVLPS